MLGTQEERTEGIKRQAQELIDQAYERGFKAGKESEAIAIQDGHYQRGLNVAWGAAGKIVRSDALTLEELRQIFGMTSFTDIFRSFSVSEATEKIRQYEEQKRAKKSVINVGDEVIYDLRDVLKAVVIDIDFDDTYHLLTENGCNITEHGNLPRTGRHFDQIADVLKQMQEE